MGVRCPRRLGQDEALRRDVVLPALEGRLKIIE